MPKSRTSLRASSKPAGLRKGGRLGKYLLEKRLGRGGFAEVWRATDTVEKRRVALKVAHNDAIDEFGRAQIEQEARIAASLHHPHIVSIRNADWVGGRFVMAWDLAEKSLAEYKKARRSPRVALDIMRQIAEGLAYAHGRRLMHRDVKPENILIFEDGTAALGDFGASLLRQADRPDLLRSRHPGLPGPGAGLRAAGLRLGHLLAGV